MRQLPHTAPSHAPAPRTAAAPEPAASSYTRKVGRNKGNARVWLEGACLLDNGWGHKDAFVCIFGNGAIEYRKCQQEGKPRRVAGKPNRPIIDTCTDKILDALGLDAPGAAVRVSVSAEVITITAE